ncbi:MAG: hypothetical protein ACOCZ5_01035 [bacterium]
MNESTEDYINEFEKEMKSRFTKDVGSNFADFITSFYKRAVENGLQENIALAIVNLMIEKIIFGNYNKK